MTQSESDPSSTRAFGQLGAVMFLCAGFVLALTQPFLDGVDHLVLLLSAGALLTAGVVSLLLPWERWPRESILALSLLSLLIVSVTARAAPGALVHYLPMYSVILIATSASQRREVLIFVMAPAVVLSYIAATVGVPGTSSTVDFTIAFAAGLLGAVALNFVVERHRETNEHIELMLRTTRELGRTETVTETIRVLEAAAKTVAGADDCITFLASGTASDKYVAVSDGEVLLEVDITKDIPVTAGILLSGEQVFISDVRSAVWGRELLESAGVRSLLCIPLLGDNGRLGALVIAWHHPVRSVDHFAGHALAIIGNEASLVLSRQREAERVQQQAQTDPLTGLLNRRAFDKELRSVTPGDCVVVVDLDHFKRVNDDHGHQAGDLALRTLAACMLDTVRIDDCCGRFGGDEFVMILRRGGLDGGRVVARQLRASWRATSPLTTLSVGIAVNKDDESPNATVNRADVALYRAKSNGRDRYEVDDGDAPTTARDRH